MDKTPEVQLEVISFQDLAALEMRQLARLGWPAIDALRSAQQYNLEYFGLWPPDVADKRPRHVSPWWDTHVLPPAETETAPNTVRVTTRQVASIGLVQEMALDQVDVPITAAQRRAVGHVLGETLHAEIVRRSGEPPLVQVEFRVTMRICPRQLTDLFR